jgi:hypothetical protein
MRTYDFPGDDYFKKASAFSHWHADLNFILLRPVRVPSRVLMPCTSCRGGERHEIVGLGPAQDQAGITSTRVF